MGHPLLRRSGAGRSSGVSSRCPRPRAAPRPSRSTSTPASASTPTTEHIDAPKTVIEWLASDEAATIMAAELPGFFPVQEEPPAIDDPHAPSFLSWNADSDLDVRFSWPVLSDGTPDAYTLDPGRAPSASSTAPPRRRRPLPILAGRHRRVVRTRSQGAPPERSSPQPTREREQPLVAVPHPSARRSTSGSWRSRC